MHKTERYKIILIPFRHHQEHPSYFILKVFWLIIHGYFKETNENKCISVASTSASIQAQNSFQFSHTEFMSFSTVCIKAFATPPHTLGGDIQR